MPDAIYAFQQFVRDTGPAIVTSAESIVNDQQLTNYQTLGYLSRGQKMSEIVQGGSKLQDTIFLRNENRSRYYQEYEAQTYQYVNSGTNWEVYWRKWMTDISIPEDLILLNAGAQYTAKHRAQQYKSIWFQKQQEAMSGAADFQEQALWAVPEVNEMESATGRKMYSIPCFINEYPNGLPDATHPGGAWTTKMGINPVTEPNWKPQQFTYADVLPSTATVATHGTAFNSSSLIAVMDKAWDKLNFRPPPHSKEYFEQETSRPINVVLTSLQGKVKLLNSYRASGDRWVDAKDPYMAPMYDGAPIVYVAALDTAAIFPTGAAGALSTELDGSATNNQGARYYLIQPEYLRMGYFRDRMLKNIGEQHDVAYPGLLIYPILSMSNLFARSMKRHAIIYPSADIPA